MNTTQNPAGDPESSFWDVNQGYHETIQNLAFAWFETSEAAGWGVQNHILKSHDLGFFPYHPTLPQGKGVNGKHVFRHLKNGK